MFKASRLAVAVVAAFLAFPAASFAATLTVNTTADNPATVGECSGVAGDCSIRQAADKAVSGDTISIPASASPYLVAVANGFIVIPGGATVTGTGASEVTVSGQGTSQIFAVEKPGDDDVREPHPGQRQQQHGPGRVRGDHRQPGR